MQYRMRSDVSVWICGTGLRTLIGVTSREGCASKKIKGKKGMPLPVAEREARSSPCYGFRGTGQTE